jgi:diguanylate cyclase
MADLNGALLPMQIPTLIPMQTPMPKAERWLVAGWTALAAGLFAAALVAPDRAVQVFLDNASWTLAFLLSAFLAWRGRVLASAPDRSLHNGLLLGALLIVAGQLMWNVQVATGWNPFPSPADALFLAAGPAWALTVMRVTFERIAPDRVYPASLDFGGAVLALLAVTLVVYVPSGELKTGLVGAVMVLYPVSFLTAASVTALAVPSVGVRWRASHGLIIAGMVCYGLSWMHWNLLVLHGELVPGSWFNGLFSLAALALGLGARFFEAELSSDAAYRRRCEQVVNLVPLATMLMASVTLWLLFAAAGARSVVYALILGCCLLVLVLAALRQAIVVSLLDRLRMAEAAILRNEEQLYHVAHFDPLTGLPNRRYFEDALDQAVQLAVQQGPQPGQCVAVLLLDLDHFNNVNETFGHRTGDKLLVEAAKRMADQLQGQGFLARLGEDEFMVTLARSHTRNEVAQLAASLVDSFMQPWQLPGVGAQFVGASIGISLFPDDAPDAVTLVRNAHTALHAIKDTGRGTYRFYIDEFTRQAQGRQALRRRLHQALQAGELSLEYQPQLDRHRQLVGLEALMRWRMDGRMVPPDEFIPVAESSGLIVPLGRWVFETACRQAAAWDAAGFVVPVMSVNISTIQLSEPHFPQSLLALVRDAGRAPAEFVLEITESQLLDESLYATAVDLRRMGFALSIDDFGTGHSSLIKLKRLPVGELKIDKAFVSDICEDANDREICATVHALARSLQLEVVAEGVETEAQFDLLVGMGCHRFQGWLFAKALAPALIEAQWLRRSAAQPAPAAQADEASDLA